MAILSPVAPWSPSDPLPNRAPDRFRNHFKNMPRGAVTVASYLASNPDLLLLHDTIAVLDNNKDLPEPSAKVGTSTCTTCTNTYMCSAEVTLGNLIKIPPNLLLDLPPITLGRIKMFLKFIFFCLQNMVSGQQEKYIIIPHPSQSLPS